MKKYFLVIILFVLVSAAGAQISLNARASLSNLFRYGSGTERNAARSYQKEYFENLSDARISVNDIVFGLRYEISKPIEYGVDFQGIRKRFVEYNNVSEGINVRAGDFWEIIGRGMSLNVFEERPLFYDTGIDGLRASYKRTFGTKNPVKVKTEILGGRLNFNDFLNPERVETYDIRDANLEVSPVKFLNLGLNYVYAKGTVPSSFDTTGIQSYLPEGFINFEPGDFQFYASYVHKKTNVNPNSTYPILINASGDGFYSSFSFHSHSHPSLGITLDYKNYRFDLTAPDNRANDRPTRMLPFQNPPTVVKEHATTLVSRNPHVVDFNDEVGAQLDVVYAPNDKLTLNLNTAIASRHYRYNRVIENGRPVFRREDRGSDFIPSLDNAFSPYWEFFLEGEYYATDKLYAKIAYDRQNSVLYSDINPAGTEILKIHTVPIEVRYSLTNEYTLKFIVENQLVSNSVRVGDQKEYLNSLFSVSLSKSPNLSVTLNTEFTNDEEQQTGKKSWILGEVSYKINPSNTITVSYGTEKGGLRCTSGICRFVRPFEGFRATVSSKF